jgi:hypothetical protein
LTRNSRDDYTVTAKENLPLSRKLARARKQKGVGEEAKEEREKG